MLPPVLAGGQGSSGGSQPLAAPAQSSGRCHPPTQPALALPAVWRLPSEPFERPWGASGAPQRQLSPAYPGRLIPIVAGPSTRCAAAAAPRSAGGLPDAAGGRAGPHLHTTGRATRACARGALAATAHRAKGSQGSVRAASGRKGGGLRPAAPIEPHPASPRRAWPGRGTEPSSCLGCGGQGETLKATVRRRWP